MVRVRYLCLLVSDCDLTQFDRCTLQLEAHVRQVQADYVMSVASSTTASHVTSEHQVSSTTQSAGNGLHTPTNKQSELEPASAKSQRIQFDPVDTHPSKLFAIIQQARRAKSSEPRPSRSNQTPRPISEQELTSLRDMLVAIRSWHNVHTLFNTETSGQLQYHGVICR